MSAYANAVQRAANSRLVKLFMCGVSERYALLLRAGIPVNAVQHYNLAGSPAGAANTVGQLLDAYYKEQPREVDRFFEFIEKEPLPPGIPE